MFSGVEKGCIWSKWVKQVKNTFISQVYQPPRTFLCRTPHCVKSVHIRSFCGPYFPTFGMNTESFSGPYFPTFGMNTDQNTPNMDTFHALPTTGFFHEHLSDKYFPLQKIHLKVSYEKGFRKDFAEPTVK